MNVPNLTPQEQALRMADALAVAILYAIAGRMTLYRNAMKAALSPAEARWDD